MEDEYGDMDEDGDTFVFPGAFMMEVRRLIKVLSRTFAHLQFPPPHPIQHICTIPHTHSAALN